MVHSILRIRIRKRSVNVSKLFIYTSVGVTRMKQSPLLSEAATGSTSRV